MKLASDKSDSFNQNTVLKRAGSFWLNYLKDKKQARALAAACNKTKLFNYLENALNQLVSQPGGYLKDFFIEYKFENVIFTQDAKYDEDSLIYFSNEEIINFLDTVNKTQESPAIYNQGSSGIGFFIINKKDLIFKNIEDKGLEKKHLEFNPISIQSPIKGELTVNNDFFETKDFLLFVENPNDLFKNGKFLVSLAKVNFPSVYRFPLRAEDLKKIESNKYFTAFSRFQQSLDKFRLAFCAYCGVGVVDQTSELLAKVINKDDSITYVFDRQIIKIDYDHTHLIVGQTYNKDHIIGESVEVYYDKGKEGWWRKIDWKDGLCLNTISDLAEGMNTPVKTFKNLRIPNKSQNVEIDGNHLRIELVGKIEDQDAYWNYVKTQELAQNKYLLNSIEGDVGAKENPLDVFFNVVLKHKCFVVVIDEDKTPYAKKGVEFIRREVSIGATAIILYRKKIDAGISSNNIEQNITIT